MKRLILVALVFALMGFASTALAQTVIVKPSGVSFDHPDGFSSAQKYELGYFLYPVANGDCNFAGVPGAAPVQTDDLGKPTTTTGIGMTAPLSAKPKGCYKAKVRVLDISGLYSDWSVESDPFKFPPASPGKPAVK